jgi:hypothetical protein
MLLVVDQPKPKFDATSRKTQERVIGKVFRHIQVSKCALIRTLLDLVLQQVEEYRYLPTVASEDDLAALGMKYFNSTLKRATNAIIGHNDKETFRLILANREHLRNWADLFLNFVCKSFPSSVLTAQKLLKKQGMKETSEFYKDAECLLTSLSIVLKPGSFDVLEGAAGVLFHSDHPEAEPDEDDVKAVLRWVPEDRVRLTNCLKGEAIDPTDADIDTDSDSDDEKKQSKKPDPKKKKHKVVDLTDDSEAKKAKKLKAAAEADADTDMKDESFVLAKGDNLDAVDENYADSRHFEPNGLMHKMPVAYKDTMPYPGSWVDICPIPGLHQKCFPAFPNRDSSTTETEWFAKVNFRVPPDKRVAVYNAVKMATDNARKELKAKKKAKTSDDDARSV